MTLYDEIKNTFDDDKVREILILYCKGGSLYNKLVKDKNFNNSTVQTYKDNFDKYVQNPSISSLYESLLNTDCKITDKNISEYIENINKRTDLSSDQKNKAIKIAADHWLYPMSRYSNIFSKYKSYEEILKALEKLNDSRLTRELNRIKNYPLDKDLGKESRENIKRVLNISDKELEELLLLYELKINLRLKFYGGTGIMGFHINPTTLNPHKACNQKSDIKFYVNIGTDTFQFAKIFLEKCIKEKIEFKYKVVDPYRYKEYEREDKMCIWSSYENAEKIVSILKEIKQEHPEFDYQKPPMLCGTIDDFIGVGQDFDSSFNDEMSTIIVTAIKNIFGTNDENKVAEITNSNPSKITALRKEIIRLANHKGIDTKKMCIGKNTKNKLPILLETESNIEYIVLENIMYIDRSTFETTKKLQIAIEGIPKVINNKNYYSITPDQLSLLDQNLKRKTLEIALKRANDTIYIPEEYYSKESKNKIRVNGIIYVAITENELFELEQNYKDKGTKIIYRIKEVRKRIDKNSELNEMLKSDNSENKNPKRII